MQKQWAGKDMVKTHNVPTRSPYQICEPYKATVILRREAPTPSSVMAFRKLETQYGVFTSTPPLSLQYVPGSSRLHGRNGFVS